VTAARLVSLVAVAVLTACSGPAPQPGTDPGSRPGVPATPGAADEWGLSDPGTPNLARVSRYVYRELTLRRDECGTGRQLKLPVDYRIEMQLSGGRIVEATLVAVDLHVGAARQPIPRERWPPGLAQESDCMRPYLRELLIRPIPADGVYVARFSAGPMPRESAGRERAVGPDPSEPGLPGLVRMARYVYREIRMQRDGCAFENPFSDVLTYTIETEVLQGAVARARLVKVVLGRDGRALQPDQWPLALGEYVECLEPHLKAMRMNPPPTDGSYRPAYTAPGRVAEEG